MSAPFFGPDIPINSGMNFAITFTVIRFNIIITTSPKANDAELTAMFYYYDNDQNTAIM